MLGSDRRDLVTTDLLSEWTDPDTAMEAVGTTLGVFGERVSNPRNRLATDATLRNALYGVLLDLVAGGALVARRCSDGRYAFRWRRDIESAQIAVIPAGPKTEPEPVAAPEVVVEHDPAVGDLAPSSVSPDPSDRWWLVITPTAPLVFPAVSCVLALLAFVFLDRSAAVLITAELAVVGVIGLVRRVPFAALWTGGLVVAGLLVRFS